ncbi:MAG: KpsF/GutQ family sugar-phosphate isomerase [Candidatus Fermentibacteraceae bacterium]
MDESLFGEARRVFDIERRWLDRTLELAEESFDDAARLLAGCCGKVVVCGMGKSGHVGRKIAATMVSTGTLAHFLHPAEGVHGDVGMLQRGDVALVLSKSGETPEVAALIPSFRRLDIPVVAMVADTGSLLARSASVVLALPDDVEACPYDLAPTASSTAMMALGDALAMAMLRMRDFSPEDFAQVHPAGMLGRKLLTRVCDLMTRPPLPVVPEQSPLSEAIAMLTRHRGICITTDGSGALSGIFVYGDLGRLMERRENVLDLSLSDVLIRDPVTAGPRELASVAVGRMEKAGITSIVVVDGAGGPVGILYLHDALRAGIR